MLEFQNQFGQDDRCFEAEGAKLVRQKASLKHKLLHYTTGDEERTQDYCVSPLKLGFQSAWKRVSPAEREVFKARLTNAQIKRLKVDPLLTRIQTNRTGTGRDVLRLPQSTEPKPFNGIWDLHVNFTNLWHYDVRPSFREAQISRKNNEPSYILSISSCSIQIHLTQSRNMWNMWRKPRTSQ